MGDKGDGNCAANALGVLPGKENDSEVTCRNSNVKYGIESQVTSSVKKTGSIRRTKKTVEEKRAKYRTWSSEAFDEVADDGLHQCAAETDPNSREADQSSKNENTTGAGMDLVAVNKRTSSGRRKKCKSETMRKHRTWHQGYPVSLGSDSTEDEMIANIEEFIKEYVEQALDAEYFKKCRVMSSTKNAKNCENVEGKECRPSSKVSPPPLKKKTSSLIRRLRNSIVRSNPESKSNSFEEGSSPQSTSSTPEERRKKTNGGTKDRFSRPGSFHSRKEEDIILDEIERRLIQQVNEQMSLKMRVRHTSPT